MRALRSVSLLFVALSLAAASGRAQCPQIPNFLITHTAGNYTIKWDPPAGVTAPVYQIMQATGSLFCPFISDVAAYSVVGTTSATTFTVNKTIPNSVYWVFVRVQGNTCVTTALTFAADTFPNPPPKPVAASVSAPGGHATITTNYPDAHAVAIWLYRVANQQYVTAVSPCATDPKTLVDPITLAPGSYQYRLVAFNTGNAGGLAGVVSDPITLTVGGTALPQIAFSAIPQSIRAGQSTTLSWRVENASSVVIDQGIGSKPPSGSITVTPSQTTTYTLTAIGGQQNASASVTVDVNTAPAVVVSALPAAMVQTAGSAGATTSYTLTNAGGGGTVVFLSQTGSFFTQTPAQFQLAAGASQVVTVTGLAQNAGAFEGTASIGGAGVPQGAQVRIKLLSTTPPSQPVSARPAANRVDVAGDTDSSPTGTVSFANSGGGTLTGILVSDVPWIVPQSGIVNIPPQSSSTFNFSIDRSKRPDALGSIAGNISLVFPNAISGKTKTLDTTTPSVSTVAVVDTVKLTATNGAPPPLPAGDVALFIPGVGHVQGTVGLFISDIGILNPSGNTKADDLRLYYTSNGGGTQKTAAVPTLNSSVSVAFADVVKNVFGAEQQVGSLQIRSKLAAKLGINTNVFNSSNPAGTYGTAIPTFRSDRAVAAGDRLVLTGLRQDSITHTNLFLQETAGGGATVHTEFLDANGVTLGTRDDTVGAFAVAQINNVVPAGTASAILTNDAASTGRFLAFATPVDERSGDNWSVVDWSRQFGYTATDTVVIPVAGTLHGANSTFFRTDIAVMNTGSAQASGTLRYVASTGSAVDRQVTVGARQTSLIGDVVGTLFGSSSTSGYLLFTPGTGTFAITSRTYATVGDNPATYGTHVPALATSAALTLGTLRAVGSIEDSALSTVVAGRPATFRTNFGMAETTGNAVSVRVTIRFSFAAGSTISGSATASKVYDLAPNQFIQVNGLTNDILGASRSSFGDLHGVEVDFQVVSGTGAVTIFTSSTDNGTGDSILRTE